MTSRIRAWYARGGVTLAEVILEQPPTTREYRVCQLALAAVIAAGGITGVPLDFFGRPLLTGIDKVALWPRGTITSS